MSGNSLITVIIPCYNQSHFLPEAINSIRNQTYQNYEIIIVNDGSVDDTGAVAKKFHDVLLIEQNNMGLATARNIGLQKSNGEFVVFLDADDRLLPRAFETGIKILENHPDYVFVSGFCNYIDSEGKSLPTIQPNVYKSDYYLALLQGTYIWTPGNVIFRRSIFKQVSGFDSTINCAADYELYLRIARKFPIYHHGKIILEYRQHNLNMSNNYELMLKEVLQVIQKESKYVKGNESYKKALDRGKAAFTQHYGRKIICQIILSVRGHNWNKLFRNLAILCYFPQVIPATLMPKLRKYVKQKLLQRA